MNDKNQKVISLEAYGIYLGVRGTRAGSEPVVAVIIVHEDEATQWQDWIVQIHKSRNIPVPYPTMHHSEQTFTHLFWLEQLYCRICEIYLVV